MKGLATKSWKDKEYQWELYLLDLVAQNCPAELAGEETMYIKDLDHYEGVFILKNPYLALLFRMMNVLNSSKSCAASAPLHIGHETSRTVGTGVLAFWWLLYV